MELASYTVLLVAVIIALIWLIVEYISFCRSTYLYFRLEPLTRPVMIIVVILVLVAFLLYMLS